ncbi:MAG: hypothetical protein DMG07_28580 [Acidobacteria bacterium]|nr:MAG: hypothetical protein DMG07_28580 [Acidobacteriota bacterium]
MADPTLTSTTAVVDVATGRLNFKATFPDTSTNDNGATLAVAYTSGVLGAGGTAYALSPTTDAVALVLVGSLDGIFSWTWNPEGGGGASPIVHPITAAEVTAGASVITLTGATNLATVGSGARLAARTLRLSAAIATVAGDRVPLQAATLTTWSLNGTVLVANWVNGNTTFNSSRVYLWNPSVASGAVTVRVYSMPVASTGSSLLGTRTVGTLGASSGMNVRIKEDILEPLGLPTPFEDNGGNLTLEVTIEALGCSGFTQTFSSTVAYGTTPLTVIPAVAPDSGPCPERSTHSGKHFLLDRECL